MEDITATITRALEVLNVPPGESIKKRMDALTVERFAVVGRVVLAMIYEQLP